MSESREHLIEVFCAMRFDPKKNPWDSTFFGKYHSRIESLGYTQKEEKREVTLQVNAPTAPNKPPTAQQIMGTKMIFRNPAEKTAIMLSANYISFHKLYPYTTWSNLMERVVDPGIKIYKEIGLGSSLIELQCLYLNKHPLTDGKMISNIFQFLPTIEQAKDENITFQAKYDLADRTSVQLKLNSVVAGPGKKEVYFECATFVKAGPSDSYSDLAIKAHDQANNVIQKLTSRSA